MDGGDWDETRIALQRFGEDPTPVTITALDRVAQHGLIADFVAAIASGTPPDTDAANNIHSLAIVFAAVESAETGNVVHLD